MTRLADNGKMLERRRYKTLFESRTVKPPLKKAAFVLAVIVCALLIPCVLMLDLRRDPDIAEWWTTHIAAALERIFGTLTSWLPFSVFEFLLVCVIGLGVFLYVRLIIDLGRKNLYRILVWLLAVLVGAAYVFNMYIITMAFAYYRKSMPLPQSQEQYNAAHVAQIAEFFLDDYNRLADSLPRDNNGCVICPYTFDELTELMKKEYARLDDGYFNGYTPTAKPVVNSWFLSQMLITGITFLPTGEANVNVAAPPTTVTATLAHELAHTKGVFREGDANTISRYILLTSSDEYLRYCGYYYAFDNLLDALILADDPDSYVRIGLSISEKVYSERVFTYAYWRAQPNIIGRIAEFFNNWYLESNGATNGTGSYDDGEQGGVITPTDPVTGEPERDPITDEPVRIIYYSQIQKMFFAIYEAANAR